MVRISNVRKTVDWSAAKVVNLKVKLNVHMVPTVINVNLRMVTNAELDHVVMKGNLLKVRSILYQSYCSVM